MDAARFFAQGWVRFPFDAEIADWAARTTPLAAATMEDAELRAAWLRCGGTWFAGVNALPNDPTGAVPASGIPPLAGGAVRFIAGALGLSGFDWDRAQVSICLPGYPQPWEGESEATFRYRRHRDAAHLDGLKRDAARRRRPDECHGFILGLPLSEAPADAAPFVVWEGSHEIMRAALRARLAGIPPERWREEDVTDAYVAARRTVFATCPRVEVAARPGEAYLAHRLMLHGVAPWTAPSDGMRMIAYFRPDPFPAASPEWWLDRP